MYLFFVGPVKYSGFCSYTISQRKLQCETFSCRHGKTFVCQVLSEFVKQDSESNTISYEHTIIFIRQVFHKVITTTSWLAFLLDYRV